MHKRKLLLILASFFILICAVSFLLWEKYAHTARKLTFENHDPLRKDLSDPDFQELFKMYQDCFQETKRENLRRYFMKYKGLDSAHAESYVQRVLADSAMDQKKNFGDMINAFVMRDRGELIGLFQCRVENELTHGSMMVFNVCVRKDKRGQGYGEELMKHSFEKCIKPGKDLTLTVYKDHTNVVQFYKNLGFEIISDLDQWDHLFPYFNKYLMKYMPNKTTDESRPN